MMSLRAAARSAPRTLTRLSSTAARSTTASASASVLSVARPLARSSWAPLRSTTGQQLGAAFSTTPLRGKPAGQVDEELSVKLESELQFESEMKENEQQPASVKDFLANSPFELKDVPGKEDVYLVRKFGNETITVSFSISDITNFEPEQSFDDQSLGDEDLDTPEGRQAESEADAAEEDGVEGEEGDESPVPFRLNVVVEKPGKGALNIEALAQDGQIMVENFYYFKDPRHAHSDSAEVTHTAQDVYPGPPFGSLDEDLQVLLERYLEERGVTQALAVFVPDYMDMKEQREYQAWLKDVKDFVDA